DEFARSLGGSAFGATSGSLAAGRYDLLTTLLHEVGHLMGFTDEFNGFTRFVTRRPDGALVFDAPDVTAILPGGDGDHLSAAVYRGDLMNANLAPAVRKVPSTLDVAMLEAAWSGASGQSGSAPTFTPAFLDAVSGFVF